MKTVIRAGKIANFDGVIEGGYVAVSGKTIVYMGSENVARPEDRVIDASDMIVIPGAIDTHTHLNDPGDTDSEDFCTGTAAAVAGGITSLFDMPQTVPLVATEEAFREKKRIAASKAYTNFGLWLAATPENMGRLGELAELGAVGFKSFLSYSGYCKMVNLGQLYEIMHSVAGMNKVLGVHCENQDIADAGCAAIRARGGQQYSDFARGRGPIVERVAAIQAMELAKETNVKLNLLHTSLPEVVQYACKAKAQGFPIAVESAPHYFLLNSEALDTWGPFAQCAPPLREEQFVEGLWQELKNGNVDFFGSDHCNYTIEEKNQGGIWKTPLGITGIQTMIPALYDAMVVKRRMSLCDFVRVTSYNAAQRFGLHKKGYLGEGYDGDFCIIDPAQSWQVIKESLLYKSKWSPYEGCCFSGKVWMTMVNGEVVYKDGSLMAKQGCGDFLYVP